MRIQHIMIGPVGRELMMLLGIAPVLLVEMHQFGLYWFGKRDTLRNYLRRMARGALATLRVSKGSVKDLRKGLESLAGSDAEDDKA